MLVLLIFLWIITIILIITDSKSESTRWLSAMTFFSGLGGLSVVIIENVIPYFKADITKNPIIIDILQLLSGLSSSFSHYLSPYALLVFCIVYSNCFKEIWKIQKIKFLSMLLLPVVLMYIFYPVYPVLKTSYPILSIWVTPYVLIGNCLLIFTYLKAKGTRNKQQILLTCILLVPATLMSLVTNYLLPAFKIDDVYNYNVLIIALQFFVFLFFAVKQGALGVKLTFEKLSMDRSFRALTSGTAILNHTIKNEVMKLSMCMNNIQYSTLNAMHNMPEIAEINENIKIANNSIDFLTVMTNKIQKQVKDIVLEESQNSLGGIIDKALNMVIPFTKERNTNIVKNFNNDLFLLCDSVHLQETFSNILNNAIEAIGSNGEVTIDVYENKKFITVAIKDNGPGISKENLPRVVDPFFSTKNHTQNFGLGLSYCYSVMQQHGGRLDIQSEEGMGTSVLLDFPVKRKLRKKFNPDNIGVEYL